MIKFAFNEKFSVFYFEKYEKNCSLETTDLRKNKFI